MTSELDPVAEIVEPAMSTSEPHYQSTIVRAVSSPNAVLRVHPIEDLAKTASVPVVDETLHDPPCDRCKLRELACTRTANEACEHCFKSKSRCSFVPGRAIPTRKQKRKATSEPDILEKAPPPRKARLTGPSSILPSTGAPSTALPADDEPEVSTLTAPSLSTEQQTLPSAVNEVAVRTAVEPRLLSIATFISYIPDIHSSLSAVRDSVRYSASSIETCAAMLVSTLRTVENKLSQALDLVAEIQRKLPPTNPSSQSANDGQPQGSTSNALTPAAPLPNPDRSVQFVLPAPPRTTPSPRAAATGSARAKPKRRSTARPVSRGGSSQVSK
ncbi:hypothetical protein FA95DRAFT_899549 [Auriscalpium vulgare]|uniref:Uncharacterized protein n=1 Tax=Auriscalpium vulgare TaxID=40419 RepID=A0ACB8R853_9AGAM|nr:hypothetical protein FA95DRAFT_899549 [Auriscalpium vulgare]